MEKAKLEVRQKELDEAKWYKSMLHGDLSGKMPYCEYCTKRVNGQCVACQKDIEDNCYCAKAWNKMNKEEC